LKMSSEKGAFIANFGRLFVTDTTVTGWKENGNAPDTFVDRETFRPFLVFWSGSKTWLASSEFLSLGYNFPKSYGISFSSSAKMLRKNGSVPASTGWVVNCHFENIYYGFYSYEADDVAIIRNTYKDNVVYGIDPHDRSHRLIIAENNSYGAKKRHGIIVSREVNNSWIFNNHTHDNHGSGIMIDRNSRNNIVADNLSENNGADGLVFFESPDNISWNNKFLNNKKNGVRIRNSANIVMRGDKIINNGSYGVEAYTASLEDQETRDTKLDPYKKITSYDIANTLLDNNKSGHFLTDNIESARYANLKMIGSYEYFKGDFEPYEAALCAAATSKDMSVKATANNRAAPLSTDVREDE
ncbi:MAG TPA: right-handed parallel beta-helix repeat-containing protein, partial [Micavibrio sp.]